MSTISKEAQQFAQAILDYIAHTPSEQLSDRDICSHIPAWERMAQSLLDAQNAESEKALADKQAEVDQARTTRREFQRLAMEKHKKDEATITELRAACAEKDEALEWAMGMEPSPCRCMDFATPPHVCKGHSALSCHGESLLAELAELRRINNAEYTEAGWFRAKELEAELKAKDEEVKRLKEELEKSEGSRNRLIVYGLKLQEDVRTIAQIPIGTGLRDGLSALRARAESAEKEVSIWKAKFPHLAPLESATAVKEQGDKV